MNYYFYKLIPPRATFPADITPEEMALMQKHSVYWKEQIEAGNAIVVGPVADPKGAFGVGILRANEQAVAEALAASDPVILADVGFGKEIYAMPRVLVAGGV
jgi:uncharacterized protein YciI